MQKFLYFFLFLKMLQVANSVSLNVHCVEPQNGSVFRYFLDFFMRFKKEKNKALNDIAIVIFEINERQLLHFLKIVSILYCI